MDRTTPVVILKGSHHGGLGIARSLGRLGIPVYCADSLWEPTFVSRYCRGRFALDIENDAERSVGGLLDIGRRVGGRPILIPTTDRATSWVVDNATALREVYSFPTQDAALVRTLCDKGRMKDLARANGVPTAQSILPGSKHDVAQFAETAIFPVMIKAIDAERLRRRAGGTKFLIHTRRELLDLYAKAEDPAGPNLLIQEFIPGEDWMLDGYFDGNSRCIFGITGKKIRRFPVKTGVTSLGICLRNETVLKTTTEFVKAIGYRGILDIGYRYDYRDGQYKVLDVNPRIGCTFRLFTDAGGMDVARALYLDLTGQTVISAPAVEGRKWIVEDFDLVSSLSSLRAGEITPREWIKSLRGIQETACFALDDPLPFLLMWWSDFRELYRWRRCRASAKAQDPSKAGETAPRPAVTADSIPTARIGRP